MFNIRDQADYSKSLREEKRRESNTQFYEEMANNSVFRQKMNAYMGCDVMEYMNFKSSSTYSNPPGHIWHIPADKPDVAQLISAKYYSIPEYQNYLNPREKLRGGFSESFMD